MKTFQLRTVVLLVMGACFFVVKPVTAQSAEKVGVLVVGAGEGTTYDPRWLYGYYEHLFPFWPPGFFAGRTGWEGEACYTQVHFASEAEALICGVPEGSVIDIFCQVHPEYEGNDPETGEVIAHGIFRHAYFLGDDFSFKEDCYDDGNEDDSPIILYTLLGSVTENPSTDWRDNWGVHVDDPNGPGIGIDEFTEQGAFNMMETHAVHFSALNHENPYTGQIKEWVYGAGGTTNIEDEVNAAVAADPGIPAGTTVVFRDASEAYVENKDMHGNHVVYPDSVETAFDELINDEGVDRIVVFSLASSYANVINYGPHWRDANGDGVSVIPGKTYAECIEDVNDGYGPATAVERDLLIAEKPWDMYKTIMREADLINADRVPLSFTQNYGTSGHYDQAALEVLEHAIAKYSIPDTAALKVIIASHGYASGWRDGAACDSYFRTDPIQAARIVSSIETQLAWNGKLTVVPGPVEFAQPGEGANYDPPSAANPFGQVLGAGEQVDMAIKGTYLNEVGAAIDNGTTVTPTNAVHDYVIVIPLNWDGESVDTLTHARPDILGNMEAGEVEGNIQTYVRQHGDQDGTEYGEAGPLWPYHDGENYTHRVMDASGWCSEAADTTEVCRGSADPNPTEVIITGTLLSHPDGDAREAITLAATEVIVGAIKDPAIGGYDDTPFDPLPEFANTPTTSGSQTALSTDSGNPTTVGGSELIYWWYADESLSCTEDVTVDWQYRVFGSGDAFTVVDLPAVTGATLAAALEAWGGYKPPGNTGFTGYTRILGGGTFEFQAVLTDCADQTVTSESYFLTVDLEPQITKEPTAFSFSGPLIVLSADIGNPAAITEDHLLYWWISDDEATCSDNMASSYQYRAAGSGDAWAVVNQVVAGTGGIPFEDAQNGVGGVLTNSTPFTGWASMFGSGTWEIQQEVTDCAGQTVTGDSYYFSVTN
jgi:hypothetical protein